MRIFKKIIHVVLVVLGLAPRQKDEIEQQPPAHVRCSCSVRDCWGEMADRIREGRRA